MREPTALLVGSSPEVISTDEIIRLAEQHDLVVAVDGGYDVLEGAGVGADILVGDLDSITETALAHARGAARVEEYPSDKDASDLSLALSACERHGVVSMTLVGVSGGRLDHELAALGVIARHAHLRPVVRAAGHTATVLSAAARESETFAGVGRTISVFAVTGPAVVSMAGFRWDADHLRLEPLGDLGLSNVVAHPVARVTVHRGVVVAIAPNLPAEC